jgi:simple sugar transport system ATP-binding protein
MTQNTTKGSTLADRQAEIVLSLEGITKRFGALLANDKLDLTLRSGEILALLGENGAGKTTLMNILFGHYVQDEGVVRVAGTVLPPGSPGAALAAGVGMVHQHFALAENLSGLDNIRLGTEPLLRLGSGRTAARRKVEQIMGESGLTVDLDRRVAALTVGEKQRVEILKALYRDVRVLILDEPTAVLTPQEAEGLFAVLRRLAGNSLGVIFISHKLGEVLAVSHRIAVLRGGRKAGELETAQADRRAIADLMVGKAVAPVSRTAPTPRETLVEFRDVSLGRSVARAPLTKASFVLRAGEIVGVAGVSGNGQAAIAALLSGLAMPDTGQVLLEGAPITADPRALVAAGIARMPEDRQHDGVVGTMSVADNIAIEEVRGRPFARMGFLDRKAMRKRATAAIAAYDIRCPGPDAEARLLSGGNVQKLILARVLEREPRVILANQPTRGLDVGAQAEVHRRIIAARDRGAAVLVISEDLDELFALADRFLVVHRGEVLDAGASAALDRGTIGLLMAGQTTTTPSAIPA